MQHPECAIPSGRLTQTVPPIAPNFLPNFGTDELCVAPPCCALNYDGYHFAGRVIVFVARAQLVDDRVIRNDDLIVSRMQKGAVNDVILSSGRKLRQETGAHVQQMTHQNFFS